MVSSVMAVAFLKAPTGPTITQPSWSVENGEWLISYFFCISVASKFRALKDPSIIGPPST